jgi:hypothetical protein
MTNYSHQDDTSPTLYWSQLECSIAVVCACLPTLRIVLNDVSVHSLRQFASKFSLRSIAAHTPSQQSLPQWDENLAKADSLTAVFGTGDFTASVQSEPPSQVPEGIMVEQMVHQRVEGR